MAATSFVTGLHSLKHGGRYGRVGTAILVSAIAVPILIEVWHFVRLAFVILHTPPLTSDAYLYFAVGRSLLNGLSMYRDLFESKPPLIFWLAAMSLKMSQPTAQENLQLLLLLSLAPVMATYIYNKSHDGIAASCAALLGVTVAFELGARTGGIQPEGFGAPLAVISILLFTAQDKHRAVYSVLSGISLGFAAMVKEPFVAAAVLGMCVFCRGRAGIVRLGFVLVIGAVTALAILVLSGALDSYFSLYLPEMFSGRTENAIRYVDFQYRVNYIIAAPLWVRVLNAYNVFTMMAVPIQSLLLPTFFSLCVLLFAALATEFRKATVIFGASLIAVCLFSAHQAFLLYELVSIIGIVGKAVPWGDPLIVRLIALAVAPPIALVVGSYWFKRTYPISAPMQLAAVATLVGIAITAALVSYGGNYDDRYMGFSVPPLIAVSLFCLVQAERQRRRWIVWMLFLLLSVNACVPGRLDFHVRPFLSGSALAADKLMSKAAGSLDELMEACGVQRYFLGELGDQQLVEFTKHSPFQITYGQERALGGLGSSYGETAPNPFFEHKYFEDLKKAQIVVALPSDDPYAVQKLQGTGKILPLDTPPNAPTSQLPEAIAATLRNEFTTSPPRCATGLVPIDGIKLFFRRS